MHCSASQIHSQQKVPVGRWVHVAARIDGTNGQVSIFMDGVVAQLEGGPGESQEGSRRPGSREDFAVSFLVDYCVIRSINCEHEGVRVLAVASGFYWYGSVSAPSFCLYCVFWCWGFGSGLCARLFFGGELGGDVVGCVALSGFLGCLFFSAFLLVLGLLRRGTRAFSRPLPFFFAPLIPSRMVRACGRLTAIG